MEYSNKIVKTLTKGGIGILPTDTLYGLVGSAMNKQTVEKIYKIRKRAPQKPMIILISSLENLKKFNINLTKPNKIFLKNLWPNPVSVILPCENKNFEYLHRGTKTLAFRIPNNKELLNLIQLTGPLIAPSANFEGEKPSKNIDDAKKYFGNNVDFYVDAGILDSPPSTLIKMDGEKITILRQGSFSFAKKEFKKDSFKLKENQIS